MIYDVEFVVLGSGFGGSLMAMILASQGRSIVMIDNKSHPRFAIGESSTPTADLILKEIATHYQLPELVPFTKFGSWQKQYSHIGCGCKRGFSYLWHGEGDDFKATKDHSHELLVAAGSSRSEADTHWFRADTDQYFATLAEKKGVVALYDTTIHKILHVSKHQWNIEIEKEDGRARINASFIIDATGAAGVLLKSLDVEDQTTQLHTNSQAIYSHFQEVPTTQSWASSNNAITTDYPFPIDDSAVHHLFSDGWLWQLRFENKITSIGWVAPQNNVQAKKEQVSPEQTWQQIINKRPALAEILGSAKLGPKPGQLIQTRRLQRLYAKAAGEDWAALPSTVGFIDPMHSTGIAHNLSGVSRLAEILCETTNQRAEQLNDYSMNMQQEFVLIDLFVAGCYLGLNDFRLFTAWSMIYFAAATVSEKVSNNRRRGFLNSEDTQFQVIVQNLFNELQSCCDASLKLTDADVRRLERLIEQQLKEYNQVGLFNPETNNMYFHTAAS